MSEVKHTPWFPRKISPVRKGVYQTKEPNGDEWFNYFDGKSWHWGSFSACTASGDCEMTKSEEMDVVRKWRGIAKATGSTK